MWCRVTTHSYAGGGAEPQSLVHKSNYGQRVTSRLYDYIGRECDNKSLTKENKFEVKCERLAFETPAQWINTKTLENIMTALGHKEISLMKIDQGGLEYRFLEEAIDALGCLPVQQLAVQWQLYTFDNRYGAGSSTEIHGIIAPLDMCGLRMYKAEHHNGGDIDETYLWLVGHMPRRFTKTFHLQI